jgi:hypothetical protein
MIHRLLAILICFLCIQSSGYAQNYSVHRAKKIYLGLAGGMTFSGAHVVDRYSVAVTGNPENTEKEYGPFFKNTGALFGLYVSYSVTNKIAITLQPSYQISKLNYINAYSWNDSVSNSAKNIELLSRQAIGSIYLPISVRWDFTTRQFSPFIQGGVFFDFKTNASKTIFFDDAIDSEVDVDQANRTESADISPHVNTFNFGLNAGLGVSYFTNYFALTIEGNFNYGFRSIVSDQNRYADYSGFTTQYLDVLDQLKLYRFQLQLSLMFPIDNSISLGILRKRRH